MLSVQNLNDSRLLNPISFSVNAGECVVIKGANGSGKTTLLRFIVGVLESDAVKLNTSHSYLAHTLGFFPDLKVCDYLKFPENIFKESFFTKRIAELSAGQKQQLSFTLMRKKKAKLWILDEPTAHLDKMATDMFYEIIYKHCQDEGGVLIASHNEVPNWVRVVNLA